MAERHSRRGFTMIEALVALAIISIAAVALITTAEATLRRVYDLELRRGASWEADAFLARMALGLTEDATRTAKLFGTNLASRVSSIRLGQHGLEKLTVEVFATVDSGGDGTILARQIGFRRTALSGSTP